MSSFDYFVDERHALYVGWVLGIAMRNGVPARPVMDDENNYTDRLIVPFGDDSITLCVPYPPDDWTFTPERNPDAQAPDRATRRHAQGDALQPPEG